MANQKKQICLRGHDTAQVGRNTHNVCRQCAKETSKLYYKNFPEKAKASIKKWADLHKEQKKDRVYRRDYGISLEDYKQMAIEQRNYCLICKEQKELVVDHCHITGKIRGLLCHSCNRGIGFLGDDPARLQSAVEYLSRTLLPA